MIRLVRVDHRFDGSASEVLSNLSFSVARGEPAFVTGPDGAGKTTLMRLLRGELLPSAGEILVRGHNLSGLTRAQLRTLRRQLGFVFQDSRLLPDLRVDENVALPLRIAGGRLRRQRARVMGTLEELGVAGLAVRYPRELSAGQAQRVAIARALVARPVAVLADEPTGNLDPQQAREVMALLIDRATVGATLLIATHDLRLAEEFGLRRLELLDGKLAADRRGRTA